MSRAEEYRLRARGNTTNSKITNTNAVFLPVYTSDGKTLSTEDITTTTPTLYNKLFAPRANHIPIGLSELIPPKRGGRKRNKTQHNKRKHNNTRKHNKTKYNTSVKYYKNKYRHRVE